MLQIAFEYIKRGEFASGLPYAEKAVQIAPSLFPGRNALGRILLETGEVARAVKELEIGVKLAPDSPEMHFALARAYARAGRKEDAARERAIFTRLDQAMRTQREGPQSVGGVGAKPEQKPPK
jgi:predicted Zn-dependent protease